MTDPAMAKYERNPMSRVATQGSRSGATCATRSSGVDGRRHRDDEEERDREPEEAPADQAGARVEALVGHARNAEVRGRARARPSARSRIAPATPARSRKSSPAAEPRMTALLAKASAAAAPDARTVACTTSVAAGRPVRGSIRWWASGPKRWTLVPDVATPHVRRPRPGAAWIGAQHDDGQEAVRAPRVLNADLPAVARRDAHRDVPVRVDDRAGISIQEAQRAVGEPALADPVEVEAGAGRPGDRRVPRPGRVQAPRRACCSRTGRARRAALRRPPRRAAPRGAWRRRARPCSRPRRRPRPARRRGSGARGPWRAGRRSGPSAGTPDRGG